MQSLILNNPFVVGRYVSDHYFCDRRSESEYLVKQIINGRNVALISPRRMGKTGLIQHCFNQEALASDYYTFFVDIYATGSLSEFVYLLGKAIFEQLKPRKTVWSERSGRHLQGHPVSSGIKTENTSSGHIARR